jgi:hypothetical protein
LQSKRILGVIGEFFEKLLSSHLFFQREFSEFYKKDRSSRIGLFIFELNSTTQGKERVKLDKKWHVACRFLRVSLFYMKSIFLRSVRFFAVGNNSLVGREGLEPPNRLVMSELP